MECENCGLNVTRTYDINGIELCENCCKEHFNESKVRKPGRIDQNAGFKTSPELSQLLHQGKTKVTSELTESLRKLPISQVQDVILSAVATLTAATSIYGDKWIAESLKNQKELADQQSQIMHSWRVKQQLQEREKKEKSQRGNERKFYKQTGKFMDEFVTEMVSEFEKRVRERYNP